MNATEKLQSMLSQPDQICFADVMALVDKYYDFTETAFVNGEVENAAGENNGSCKVFALAKLHNLNESETLALFGEHYRDVAANPNGDDHQNIRNFQQSGFAELKLSSNALSKTKSGPNL